MPETPFAHHHPNNPSMVVARDVTKIYPGATGDFLALKSVSFHVERGEFVVVRGKSGAGKTTLVNMIAGIDRLTSGDVQIGGVSIHSMTEDRRARWRGLAVGVVYQSFYLMPTLSLLENVMLPMDFCGKYRHKESMSRATHLLDQVGLKEHARKLPSEISGGQQQRVAIARALANDPDLIVADEPTGRLDSVTAGVILDIFLQLVSIGKTILMVTHDQAIFRRVDRVLTLVDGELIDGTA